MKRRMLKLAVCAVASFCGMQAQGVTPGTIVIWGESTMPNIQQGTQYSALAAGGGHNLTVKMDGTVVAWGINTFGECTVPVNLNGVTAVAAGGRHSLALKTDGTVVAWGDNSAGQATVPGNLSGVKAITAGESHSLALKTDGTVVAWGDNSAGQTTVPGNLNGVTAVAAGAYHSAALKTDGTVIAWGENSFGQSTVPGSLSGVAAIAAGWSQCLALKTDGTVVGWGDNSAANATSPGFLSGVTAVAASGEHDLALTTNGTVVAWGTNLGSTNSYTGQSTVPENLNGVIAVAAALYYSLALRTNGTVVAWGDNPNGQTNVPVNLNGVMAIAAGADHCLALKTNGTVIAWGGDGYAPGDVPGGLSGVTAIAAGEGHSLALKTDGTVVAWGSHYNILPPVVPSNLNGVIAIAAGSRHCVALKTNGTVVAWGDNGSGQCTVPANLTGVMAVAAGRLQSLALKTNGTVVAWGDDTDGQSTVPGSLNGVVAIAAGGYDSLAIVAPSLIVVSTNRTPTTAEIIPIIQPPGTSPTQLVTFVNGAFTTNAPDPSKMTIVLTHGWNSSSTDWPKAMAQYLAANLLPVPNIVAWDWTSAAKSVLPGGPADNAMQRQGPALGDALQNALGSNYSQPIHFIGHSLGTLVNASAVNYVHRESWAAEDISPRLSWTNLPVQLTLFDEAEIATGISPTHFIYDALGIVSEGSGNFYSTKRYNWHPLPKTFVWADNYITAFGIPHREAVNIILTNTFPASGVNISTWWDQLAAFHGYPCNWYDETIANSGASTLGWRWSFEQGGWFDQAPKTNTVYIQAGGSPWNLTQTTWDNATNWLDGRIESYLWAQPAALSVTAAQTANNLITANGTVRADELTAGPPSDAWNIIINFFTEPAGGSSSQSVSPKNLGLLAGASSDSNVPAYAWVEVAIPTNAVAMSFDFKLLGDGASDSFVAAINGTNVLSLAANLIETNLLMNSGQIPVSTYTGQTVELFFGIAGGTSTNAQVTVQDILFYTLVSGADFGITDSVGDGIPDSWRAQYFPDVDPTGATTGSVSCATCDADGTGQNNLFKFLAGLNPTNPASIFTILSTTQQGIDFNVTWQTAGGHTNVLQATSNLAGSYSNVSPNIVITGTGDTTTNYPDAGGATNGVARFYRIRLVP